MKKVLEGTKGMTVDEVFDMCDRDRSNKMEITEFNDVVKQLYSSSVNKVEIDSLFRHFDSKGIGYISKDDFKKALTEKIALENTISTTLQEIMSPLQTKLRLL